ncbi:MAG: ROK family protein [Planctomycetes bacterium]|nr:ROK family protein [Planctomycetota bacterium]
MTRLDASAAVGCDVGGTAIKLARLTDGRAGESVALDEVPTPARAGSREVVAVIAAAVTRLLGHGEARRRRRGTLPPVGIALPGFLDPERSRVVRLSNLPALDGVPLRTEIERRTGARVVLDTDTNAGAVAEARRGAGRGFERVLYVTMGTGLGTALSVGGGPVRVSRHTVGQAAHVPLDAEGPRCPCGDRGCAETLLSERGVLWRARRAGLEGIGSSAELHRLAIDRGGGGRARAARGAWREVGLDLGRLLRILAGLFSPDVIVVGGGVAGAAGLFIPEAARHLERRLGPRLGTRVLLKAARLGRHAGAIGAALLARDAAEGGWAL